MMQTQTTDPIADFLTRIRNGLAVGHSRVSVPHSKVVEVIANLLKKHKFIMDVKTTEEDGKGLELMLSTPTSNSPITGLERISKPGRRVYVRHSEIPLVMAGQGLTIVSTSHGIMDGKSARQQKLGGELMCKVW